MAATPDLRPWLPAGAVGPERIQPVLADALAQWSVHWFANARATLAPAFQDDWPVKDAGAAWRLSPEGASLCLASHAAATLSGAMLGANVPQGPLQDSDRAVVDRLAQSCVEDLLRRIDRLATVSPDMGDIAQRPGDLDSCGWWEIALGAGRRVLSLGVPLQMAVGIVRRQVPARPMPRPVPVRKALGAQRIELAADLGRSAISLAELKGLGVGDVLVLDRSVESPVGVLVNGSNAPVRASLEASGTQACLKIFSRSASDA